MQCCICNEYVLQEKGDLNLSAGDLEEREGVGGLVLISMFMKNGNVWISVSGYVVVLQNLASRAILSSNLIFKDLI